MAPLVCFACVSSDDFVMSSTFFLSASAVCFAVVSSLSLAATSVCAFLRSVSSLLGYKFITMFKSLIIMVVVVLRGALGGG